MLDLSFCISLNACDKNFTYALDFVISLQCYETAYYIFSRPQPHKERYGASRSRDSYTYMAVVCSEL